VYKRQVLKIQDLVMVDFNSKIVLKNVSFNVRKGEILGIAGVEGNGQRELTEIITNMYKATSGKVFIGGQDIENYSIRQVRELKVSHISEDRMTYGVVSNGTIMENTISDRYYKKEFNRNLLLDFKKTKKLSEQLIKDYNIYCDDYDQPIRMLSGGNMQKVVAAREFSSSPKLIIANQPTRGIDVGASEFIRNKLVSMRDEGCAVLLITADLNEVLEVSDNLIVMCDGEIVAYFEDVSTLTEDELGEYMLGLRKQDEDQIRRAAYEQ
jgi:simple sugar transport system ATP-binding protein